MAIACSIRGRKRLNVHLVRGVALSDSGLDGFAAENGAAEFVGDSWVGSGRFDLVGAVVRSMRDF